MFNNITYAQWLDMCIGAIIQKAGGCDINSTVSDQALNEIKHFVCGVHQPSNVADSIVTIARANKFDLLAS